MIQDKNMPAEINGLYKQNEGSITMGVLKGYKGKNKAAGIALFLLIAGMTMPISVQAAEVTATSEGAEVETEIMEIPMPETAVTSGTCGTNVTWSYDSSTKTLTISGSGEMKDYTSANGVPWYNERNEVEKVIVGEEVKRIGNYAFYACSNLHNVKLPIGLKSIGNYVFEYCERLSSIELQDGITSIGNWSFAHCGSLKSIELPDGLMDMGSYVFYQCSSLSNIRIPDDVTSIGSSAFQGCNSLNSIQIPDSVTSIGSSAFQGCNSLNSIQIPDGVTSIGNSAFQSCNKLSSIELPDDLKNIGKNMFVGCTSLSSITIPNNVSNIGEGAFCYCNSLNNVYVPNDLEDIGNAAFYGCSSLRSIELPAGLKSMGRNVFSNCTDLSTITIPGSVTSIGSGAFDECTKLQSATVTCNWKESPLYSFESGVNLQYICDMEYTADIVLATISEQCPRCKHLETVILIPPLNPVYTGSPVEATVNGTISDLTPVITYSGSGLTGGKPVNAGVYTVTMTLDTPQGMKSVTREYEIKKVHTAVSGSTAYVKTCGDASFEMNVAGSHGEAEIGYEIMEGGDVIALDGKKVTILKSGTAVIRAFLPETANYKPAEQLITITVYKKSGYIVEEMNKTYLFVKEHADSIDLTPLLPTDCKAATYALPQTEGGVTYRVSPGVENGILSYTVNPGEAGACGKIKVTVSSDSYEDFDIIINIGLHNRKAVQVKAGTEVTLKKHTLEAGEPLSVLEFQPAEFEDEDGNAVAGTLAWKNPQTILPCSTGTALWLFTPDNPEYATLEGMVDIEVIPSDDVPDMPAGSMEVPFAIRKVGEVSLPADWIWQEEDREKVLRPEEPLTATAVYDGADKDSYGNITAPVTITRAGREWLFTDVNVIQGHWKYENIRYIYNNEIMSGINGTNLFMPDENLNRAMFVTVLYRMAGNPQVVYEPLFTDVEEGKYYSEAVTWAKKQGMIDGYSDGSYGTERNITREQLAKILYEYAAGCGYDVKGRAEITGFTDRGQIGGWAEDYIRWAVYTGMISGRPNDDGSYRIDPKGDVTRAECAKMLRYFMEEYR